jgi:hypothetical protein
MVQDPLLRALEELISDFVGVLLFGFAALSSSYRFFSCVQGWDDLPVPNRYYPPNRFRLRRLYDYIIQYSLEGFSLDSIDNVSSRIRSFLEDVASITETKEDERKIFEHDYLAIAYKCLADLKTDYESFAVQSLAGKYNIFRFTDSWNDIQEAIKRITYGVPPTADERIPFKPVPFDLPVIANAAWLFSLVKLPPAPFSDDNTFNSDYEEYWSELNRLSLFAYEMSDLYRQYCSLPGE